MLVSTPDNANKCQVGRRGHSEGLRWSTRLCLKISQHFWLFHIYIAKVIQTRVLIDRYRPAIRTTSRYRSISTVGHLYNVCYINTSMKRLKLLRNLQTQPFGSHWTLRMTPAANLALLQRGASILTFLNTVIVHWTPRTATIGFVGSAVFCQRTSCVAWNRKLPVLNRLSVPHWHNDQNRHNGQHN